MPEQLCLTHTHTHRASHTHTHSRKQNSIMRTICMCLRLVYRNYTALQSRAVNAGDTITPELTLSIFGYR